jgi:hypothetical protein
LTGNLPQERTYSNLLSTALLDRGGKYILQFSFEKWLDWAKSNQVHDLIIGFLQSNPEFAISSDDINYASPSPRAWTLASETLFKAKDFKISEIQTISQIISGFVGNQAGLKFKIWYEHYRKFEPAATNLIESGKANINFKELSPTEKLIFVISCCHLAKQKVLREKNKNKFYYLENLCNFLISHNVDYEIQVMGFYNSFDFDMITKYKIYTCPLFFEHFKKINESVTFKNKTV